MPFDGSGNFSRVHDWTDDRDNGIKILSTRMDAEFDNYAAGMNLVFFRNGLVPMSGNLNMGQNSIYGVAAGSVGALSYKYGDDLNSGMFLDGIGKPSIVAGGNKRIEANTTGVIVTGTLNVSGASTLTGAVAIGGAATIASNLGVTGAIDVAGAVNAASDVNITINAGGTAGFLSSKSNDNVVRGQIFASGATYNINALNTAPLILGTAGTERLRITNTGTIGIGTVIPNGKLHVNHGGATTGFFLEGNTTSNIITDISVNRSGVANFGIGQGAAIQLNNTTSGKAIMLQASDDAFQIFSNNGLTWSEKLRLSADGKLGIGIVPIYKFHANLGGDGVAALFSGITKGVRVNHTTAETRVEGVSNDGSTFQPLWLGGSQVSMSESGTETARFSGGNLRVSGNVFVGSVSAGNQVATLASPAFTGVPTAPTAAGGSNDTTIATTAFVRGNFSLLASPTFTGTPAAPTAANGTNTTQLATTAFVQSQLTANAYAPLASPSLTGTPLHGGIEIGYRDIPRVTGGIERGKVFATAAGFTFNTGNAAGSAFSVYNDSAAAITITQGAGMTLRLGGTATTGNRTIAARCFATIWCNSTTEAIVAGAGVS